MIAIHEGDKYIVSTEFKGNDFFNVNRLGSISNSEITLSEDVFNLCKKYKMTNIFFSADNDRVSRKYLCSSFETDDFKKAETSQDISDNILVGNVLLDAIDRLVCYIYGFSFVWDTEDEGTDDSEIHFNSGNIDIIDYSTSIDDILIYETDEGVWNIEISFSFEEIDMIDGEIFSHTMSILFDVDKKEILTVTVDINYSPDDKCMYLVNNVFENMIGVLDVLRKRVPVSFSLVEITGIDENSDDKKAVYHKGSANWLMTGFSVISESNGFKVGLNGKTALLVVV